MAVQSDYNLVPAVGFAGQIATADGATRVTPCLQDEASASIPFGTAVKFYTANADSGARLPTTTGDKLRGITMHSHASDFGRSDSILDENGDVRKGKMVNVVTNGEIWVTCENGCTPGAPLFVRVAGAGVLGALRSAADGVNTIDCTARGTWQSTAIAGGLAKLHVDFV